MSPGSSVLAIFEGKLCYWMSFFNILMLFSLFPKMLHAHGKLGVSDPRWACPCSYTLVVMFVINAEASDHSSAAYGSH